MLDAACLRTALLALAVALVAGCAHAPLRQDYVARVELLAVLQTLNADLLSHDSATLTLQRWCADHHLAQPPQVTAHRLRDEPKPIPAEMRARLAVEANEPIAYRHVQLVCGDRVLSEADNWYVPARLTPEMNHELDATDKPFGKVVMPLGFQRRTVAAELLWSPLPALWEITTSPAAFAPLRMPPFVLRHQAVLYSAAQQPFSVVVENYTSGLFDFRRWEMAR